LLLQMLYRVRSERLLMEELDYSVLYRWFVGLSLDDTVWDATVFTKNRDRLLGATLLTRNVPQLIDAIAYTVQIERRKLSVAGQEQTKGDVLRATHVLRRENGQWRLVHRHAIRSQTLPSQGFHS
jgi:transposase